MSERREASVVIPLHDGAERIVACLESLYRQSIASRLEIIVVDDGSTDGGREIVARHPVKLHVQTRRGAAAARNAGTSLASCEFVLFLDADCIAPAHWARSLLEAFDDPTVSAVMGTIVCQEQQPMALLVQSEIDGRYARLAGRDGIDFLATPSCAFRRARFLELGGFNEEFRANEDVELAYRMNRSGDRIAFVRHAPVAHRHPTSFWDYARTKFWRGVWRLRLYRLYPGKALRDDWTPGAVKLQTLAGAALVPVLALGWMQPGALLLVPAILGLVLACDWRTLRDLAGRLTPVLGLRAWPWAAWFLVVRTLAFGAAAAYALASRLPGVARIEAGRRATRGRAGAPPET